ncbi:rod shape-determining protein RodA [uncultured Litoreibacter sp.]|uniref:rod shape-determining protein RodA n=1 Tax=uncultured Litoreibacter sp. TaxID=1392394 RepID=UPI002621B29F|nr:rod shape-determining protein RodA [uncultured Litoreibacter sp.]
MSYLEYNLKSVPAGPGKLLHLNWAIILLLTAIASVGFLMLYSVAGGSMTPWVEPQMKRFAVGLLLMFTIALVPTWFLRNTAGLAYAVCVVLLLGVEFFGATGKGAQRWIDLGFMRLQPSELTKITLILFLASYYDWLDVKKTSRPLWVAVPVLIIAIPTYLTLRQPDLGTALLLVFGGGGLMFLAGVSWMYFAAVIGAGVGVVAAVFQSRGTDWQLLKDYQYRRIDTFLDPASDPLGAGYHITQSKIALGSGGWTGRGYMQGTQSRLNFLPEKHTDFIFTTLAEEFGFVGGISLLALYVLVLVFCIVSALGNKDRFASLVTLGVALTFFLFFAVNMSMVMGLAPVVGVPLPLVSYGGSAMLVLMLAFGLVQSAHVHRPR